MSQNSSQETPFWQAKSLQDMNQMEWESLCDGCGKCCLNKLQYDGEDEIYYTNVACRLLDLKSCRCTHYTTRQKYVSDCISLSLETVYQLHWLPSTCAYRLLTEGKELPDWHPLITGDLESVHNAGMSVRYRAISEKKVRKLEYHIVTWPE